MGLSLACVVQRAPITLGMHVQPAPSYDGQQGRPRSCACHCGLCHWNVTWCYLSSLWLCHALHLSSYVLMLADNDHESAGHVQETAQVQPYHVQPFQVQAMDVCGNPAQLGALLGSISASAVLRLTMMSSAINMKQQETLYNPTGQQSDQTPLAVQLPPGSHVAGLLGTIDSVPGDGQSVPVQHAELSDSPAWDRSQMMQQCPGTFHPASCTPARAHTPSYEAGDSCREVVLQPTVGPGSPTPEGGSREFVDWLDNVFLEGPVPSIAPAAPFL